MRIDRKVITFCLLLAACGASTQAAPPETGAPGPVAAQPISAENPGGADTAPAAASGGEAPASAPATPIEASASAPAAPATASPAATKGSISGTVTSMPARAAASAVVYLENAPIEQAVDGVLDNKQMTFIPNVVVITAGASLKFTNHDPFPHNIFSSDNEKFDLGELGPKASKTKPFVKPGAYTMLCNIHPNMKSYLIVSPSSYFSKADKEGSFSIKDVPAGTYQITAWAPGVKPSTQSVTVSGDATINFELKRK